MTLTTARLQIPYPGPGDAFKPASVDFPALAARLDAITARQPGDAILATPVLDVGQVGQIRAGRLMALTDFTALLGLTAPAGLWNLGDTSDISGNARTLTNKGTVPFGIGINGAASSAAVFAGSTAQSLYISDTGAADPFRIKAGSWGCWVRTAKRVTVQALIGKWGLANQVAWLMQINASGVIESFMSPTGIASEWATGTVDICDDKWHHAVSTYDGSIMRIYTDGVLDSIKVTTGLPIFGGSSPFNIGSTSADGATAASSPHYGRVDGAFVTPDVLSDDEVRLLYAAKVAHAYAVAPTRAHLGITRRRLGAALVTGDFPFTPRRLYNFAAGSLADLGSHNQALTINAGTGAIVQSAGPDGSRANAYAFSGAHTGMTSAVDSLVAGTTVRAFGAWIKVASLPATTVGVVMFGTVAGSAYTGISIDPTGHIVFGLSTTGATVVDGRWHYVQCVEDPAANDGVLLKGYVDGRLVTTATSISSVTSGTFRIGAFPDGTGPFVGHISRVWVTISTLNAADLLPVFQKSGQPLAVSPKNEGDHVEGLDATNVYAVFDSLDPQHLVDLRVAA